MSQPIWILQFGRFTGVCQNAHQTQNRFYQNSVKIKSLSPTPKKDHVCRTQSLLPSGIVTDRHVGLHAVARVFLLCL